MRNERWYDEGQVPVTEWERFALAFVAALVREDYTNAYEMTSQDFKAENPVGSLERFTKKVLLSQHGATGSCRVISSIDEWPAKAPNDLGMAQVLVTLAPLHENPELVTITVASVGGTLKVRSRF